MTRRGAAACIAVMLGLPGALGAQRPARNPPAGPGVPAGWTEFGAALDDYARRDSVVGALVMLVRDGRILARHAYGLGDRARGTPPDDGAIYHWASITKTLTAIAVLQLRDRGRLGLDDPITRWVPELRQVHDPYGSIDAVTLRMLLSHSAGFQNPTWPYGEGRAWEPFEPTRWEQLVAMMPYQTLEFAPGSRFGYSNPGFVYLARVIEAVTGDPWAVYVQKNIWTPLGLDRSFVGVSPYHLAAARAASYTLRADSAGQERVDTNPREFDPGITIPNSGWNAPIADLAAYVAFLAGAPPGDTVRARRYEGVLPRATLTEMWREAVAMTPEQGAGDAFGLSFYLFRIGGRVVVGHTGEQSGFRTFFYVDPTTRRGVIGVLNTVDAAHAERSNAGWATLTRQAAELVTR